jgi:hypothetical protein
MLLQGRSYCAARSRRRVRDAFAGRSGLCGGEEKREEKRRRAHLWWWLSVVSSLGLWSLVVIEANWSSRSESDVECKRASLALTEYCRVDAENTGSEEYSDDEADEFGIVRLARVL